MKKYLLLTSILSLAACGGGGGHGSAGIAPEVSNARVTGMKTEIEVNTVGETINARSATLANGNKTYDLSDVKFMLADEEFDSTENEDFKFVVDPETKKIIGLDLGLAGEESYPADGPKYFKRIDDTNTFEGLVNHRESESDTNPWKHAIFTYESMGNDLGLQYSDFGKMVITLDNNEKLAGWAPVFIGGYDEGKKISQDDIVGNVEFNGRATGHVVAIRNGEGSGTAQELNAPAKLTFNNATGTSTLKANFENWYDMTYTKTGDAAGSIQFANGDRVDAKYKLLSDTSTPITVTDDTIRYFGANGVPTEAVGVIHLRDCNGAACNSDYGDAEHPNPEVRMNLSYGVK